MSAAPLRWQGGALSPDDSCDLAEPRLLAADSWLVVDGAALALEAHRDRFRSSVGDAVRDDELAAFWSATTAAIPREGAWFPRVELELVRGAPRLTARVRPAPERRGSAVLATWTGADPRTSPTVKGPDLAAMQRLRTAVQPLGADEAVIVVDGLVVEGAYSALLWWRDGVLHAPPAALPRIPSITAAQVLALATERGVEVREQAATPADLAGAEVWVCSALHGIRVATAWVDGPTLIVDAARADGWRGALRARREPVTTVGDGDQGEPAEPV